MKPGMVEMPRYLMPASTVSGASGVTTGGASPAGSGFAASARSAPSAVYASTTLSVGWLGIALASSSCRRLAYGLNATDRLGSNKFRSNALANDCRSTVQCGHDHVEDALIVGRQRAAIEKCRVFRRHPAAALTDPQPLRRSRPLPAPDVLRATASCSCVSRLSSPMVDGRAPLAAAPCVGAVGGPTTAESLAASLGLGPLTSFLDLRHRCSSARLMSGRMTFSAIASFSSSSVSNVTAYIVV